MKVLEKVAIAVGLVVVGVTVVYRYVLSNDQREAMREAGESVRGAVQEVSDSVSPLVSNKPTKSEERAKAEENRAKTAAQWKSLGY